MAAGAAAEGTGGGGGIQAEGGGSSVHKGRSSAKAEKPGKRGSQGCGAGATQPTRCIGSHSSVHRVMRPVPDPEQIGNKLAGLLLFNHPVRGGT